MRLYTLNNQTSWMDSLSIKSKADATTPNSELAAVPYSVNPFALVPPELEEYDCYAHGYSDTTAAVKNDSKSSSTLTLSGGSGGPPSFTSSRSGQKDTGYMMMGEDGQSDVNMTTSTDSQVTVWPGFFQVFFRHVKGKNFPKP